MMLSSCHGQVDKPTDFHTGDPWFESQSPAIALLGKVTLSLLPSLLEETFKPLFPCLYT